MKTENSGKSRLKHLLMTCRVNSHLHSNELIIAVAGATWLKTVAVSVIGAKAKSKARNSG